MCNDFALKQPCWKLCGHSDTVRSGVASYLQEGGASSEDEGAQQKKKKRDKSDKEGRALKKSKSDKPRRESRRSGMGSEEGQARPVAAAGEIEIPEDQIVETEADQGFIDDEGLCTELRGTYWELAALAHAHTLFSWTCGCMHGHSQRRTVGSHGIASRIPC